MTEENNKPSITKDDLISFTERSTEHTKESFTHQVNVNGIIAGSLEVLFTILTKGTSFMTIEDGTITPYACYKVNTSPYHKNESVNIVAIYVETADGERLGTPMMRTIHRSSAETIVDFLNRFGTTEGLAAGTLFERAKQEELVHHIQTFLSRTAAFVQHIDADISYQVLQEYAMVAILEGNYDVFAIETEDFARQLTYSAEEADEETGETKPDLRPVD